MWKLAQSHRTGKLFVAPGNGGTGQLAKNLDIPATDIDGLASAVEKYGIDLTVVGPEAPLAEGIVDRFEELGIPVFGPSKAAARLESSKIFAKEVMERAGVAYARGERVLLRGRGSSLCRGSRGAGSGEGRWAGCGQGGHRRRDG